MKEISKTLGFIIASIGLSILGYACKDKCLEYIERKKMQRKINDELFKNSNNKCTKIEFDKNGNAMIFYNDGSRKNDICLSLDDDHINMNIDGKTAILKPMDE